MNLKKMPVYISASAVVLAMVHMIWPSLAIDGITIGLLVIATIPWLAPYLKSMELPGGVKIELKDVMRATEKVPVPTSKDNVSEDEKEVVSTLTRIAEEDANLALVGFRIELEKRLYKAAEINSITIKHRSLTRVVTELNNAGIIPDPLASNLRELIKLGTKAAHGVKVSDEAVEWVLQKAPAILGSVDAHFNFKQ